MLSTRNGEAIESGTDEVVSDAVEQTLTKDPTTGSKSTSVPAPKGGVCGGLHWQDVNLTVTKNTKDDENKSFKVLDAVFGESPQGQVSAIMGPSGSGKTSLLNVLSGRMSNATPNVTVQAESIHWNGRPLNVSDLDTRQTIAFVAQDDSLPVTSTPREAILFSARLRLDKRLTLTELSDITQTMLEQLHLESCADTLVGGALLKGISGGERKRTSVGVELVCKPQLIFLDEPTSGLDSFNALELVQVLKEIATSNQSAVMLTIHQPSSEIWNHFDNVTLMKQGRVLYGGTRIALPENFRQAGYPLPSNYNPADWVMEVAQTNTLTELEQAGFFQTQQKTNSHYKQQQLDNHNKNDNKNQNDNNKETDTNVNDNDNHNDNDEPSKDKNNNQNSNDSTTALAAKAADDSNRVGYVVQTQWLMAREIQNFRRNIHPLRTRTMMTLMISFMCGVLFFQVATEDFTEYINVQTTFGALMLAEMANLFSVVLPALISFPEERPVFLREYSTGQYSVTAYFTARLTMELIVTAIQVTVSTMITYLMVGFSMNYGNFWCTTFVLATTGTALGAMVGSSATDPSTALEMLPAVFMPQILFAGFFIPFEHMPVWLSWLTYIFPLTYAVRLVLVYEFDNGACEGNSGAEGFCNRLIANAGADLNPELCQTMIGTLAGADDNNIMNFPTSCEVLLDNVDANADDTWWYWIVLCIQFLFFRAFGLFILRRKAQHFY